MLELGVKMSSPRAAAALLPALLLLVVPGVGHAQGARPRSAKPVPSPAVFAPPAIPAWQQRLDAVLSAPLFRHASFGVYVQSLDNGRVLYQRDPDRALMPASNQKILTAAIALATFGPDYHFTTRLLHTGAIDKNGTLRGDVYLKGSGDPSLNSQRLLDIAQALRTKGVKKIEGRIIGDASAFDNRVLGDGWQWDDESFDFQPQVSGLNCDENTLLIQVSPGEKVGDAAQIAPGGARQMTLAFEKSAYVTITNRASTVAAGQGVSADLSFARARARNEVSVSGTIPTGGLPVSEALTVEDPARYTADRFADVLAVADIDYPAREKRKVETGVTPPEAVELVASESAPLRTLLRDFLKPSDNLYGECLLKAVGATATGGPGSTRTGAEALQRWLQGANIDLAGLHVADGSGLSRNNLVTPRLLVSILNYVATQFPADKREVFQEALPEAGTDGTMRSRLKDTFAQGRVRAKTGTLTGVSSLSGYMTTRAGERLVFSILMNNYNAGTSGGTARAAREAQDAIVLALCDVPAAVPAKK